MILGASRSGLMSSTFSTATETLYALSFDGTNGRVDCGDDPAFELQTLTLELWAYHNNSSRSLDGGVAKGQVFSGEDSHSYKLDFSNGDTNVRISDGTNDINITDVAPIDAQIWTHWAMTYDGSDLKAYKNGIEVATASGSITIQNTTNPGQFMIGARDDGQYSLDGRLSDVRLWNYARSQAEIADNANSTLTGNETGLVAYYPFDSGSGSTLTDKAGTNDGTITNATWIERDPFPNLVTSFNELFANSEFGAWYDPSDINTLWQDTSAATQVTSTGQSVARIDDKSGNGLHLTQSTSSLQPTYQEDGNGTGYLSFSLDHYMLSNTFTTPMTESGSAVWKGSNQNSDELGWALAEYLVATTDKRIAYCIDTRSSTRRHTIYGPTGASSNVFIDLDTELDTSVHTLIYNDQGTTSVGYIDGQQQDSTITSDQSFEAGDRQIVLGIRSDLDSSFGPFSGNIYQVVMLDRPLTNSEITFINNSLN